MTEKEVVKETLNRLYIIRSTTSNPTREAEWLEGVINCIIGNEAGAHVDVDLDSIKNETHPAFEYLALKPYITDCPPYFEGLYP